MLPKPNSQTTEILYRVRVKDAKGVEAQTPESRLAVTANCATPRLSTEETSYAQSLVVGQTAEAQPTVPAGFMCDGIVSMISARGEMKPLPGCRDRSTPELVIGSGTSTSKSPSGVAGGVVIKDNNGGSARPLSPSRP
jgi:hypothetical protein